MEKPEKAKPLANTELSAFCGQTALILKSGISSAEGLAIMQENAGSGEEEAILQMIRDRLDETGSLSDAFSHTGLFPDYLIHMTQIGEETGNLDEVMAALGEHYDREDAIARSIRNSIAYPLAMAGMMIVVILVLLIRVMPLFNQVFIQLGTEMTGVSRALMAIGTAISRYFVVFLVLLAALAAGIIYLTRTRSGKKKLLGLAYRLRFSRAFCEDIAACRFAGGMALTLRSGLLPDRALELTSALNTDPYFAKKLDALQKLLEEGGELSRSMHASGILGGMQARMALIGEKTGAMDQAMDKIAEHLQESIDTRMNHYLSILEPTLVIVLSLIVGAILLSVMFPLMGIMSSL